MNFNIFILACVVVLQIEKHECLFKTAYRTCGNPKNYACLAWSPSPFCQLDRNILCKNVCWPTFIACCDCTKRNNSGCFPSSSKVNLENGKSVLMSDLQLGDQVQTGKKKFILI